ncbi:heavy metal-associated isoprenylated plant protein 5-like [Euphorbia lathyris]|uniref:heavy metal-associated isoprenylated plant protein 5-like n=1 Tax=Euphorbia lathyris TaxID=212925 RepID=UPI0033142146
MWTHLMEDLQDYLTVKAMYAKRKLAFRKSSRLCDIDKTQPDQTEGEGDKAAAATADGGEKKDEPKPISVYKMVMHCEGCCKKIRSAVKHLEGVESAKTDRQSNKLTVTGEVDPEKVKARLEKKMKKEVEIVSPQPNKDGGGGEKKPEEKATKKKSEVKKPPSKEITVVLKIKTHCDGCITKMKKIIRKIKGVESVAVDDGKDLVTVKGTMEVKDLLPYLSEKLRRRSIEVVQPKTEEAVQPKTDEVVQPKTEEAVQPKTDEAKKDFGGDGDGGGEKRNDAKKVDEEGEKKNDIKKVDGGGEEKKDDNKEGAKAGEKKSDGKKNQAGAGEKKNDDKKGDERGEEAKVKKKEAPAPAPAPATATTASDDGDDTAEVIEVDYYPAYVPTHWNDGIFSQRYTVGLQHPQYGYGYNSVNQGYQIPMYNNRYMPQRYFIEPTYNYPPENPVQMFNDDNPNACSIM